MSTEELDAIAKELLSIRSMLAELEAEAETLTDKLKAAMVEQGTEVLQGDGWKVTWKNVVSIPRSSKLTTPTCTVSTASGRQPPPSAWEHEESPHIRTDDQSADMRA